MPRLGADIYAAHMDNVLKLARRSEGVTRPQIIEKLNVTRAVANGLIKKAGLELARKDGRTEYFAAPTNGTAEPEVKQSRPSAVVETATPTSTDSGGSEDDLLSQIAELDAQIVDTRNTLRDAAEKAGKALGEWATHQALVDALRQRMQELAVKRMTLSA